MIAQLFNRQGFEKSLSGIDGSAIQSAYIKPEIVQVCAEKSASNLLFSLPYPYGPLPEGGPWSGNDKNENPTPDAPTPGAQGNIPESAGGNVLMFAAVVAASWFLVYYKR